MAPPTQRASVLPQRTSDRSTRNERPFPAHSGLTSSVGTASGRVQTLQKILVNGAVSNVMNLRRSAAAKLDGNEAKWLHCFCRCATLSPLEFSLQVLSLITLHNVGSDVVEAGFS